MKSIIFFFLLLCASFETNAQVFNFGIERPYAERRQSEQNPVTLPKYKNGSAGVNEFIKKHFRYIDGKSAVSGRIIVACLINEKGNVVDTDVIQGLDAEMNNEAVRVVKELKFKPAKRGKKKVKSRYDVVFPIRHGKVSFVTAPTIDL